MTGGSGETTWSMIGRRPTVWAKVPGLSFFYAFLEKEVAGLEEHRGWIHSVESMGLVDGPGIRAVVFLQGCRLRCRFCHNPDTWSQQGGEEMTPRQLVEKLRRFRPYFSRSGGGVTFSGGEPLMQPDLPDFIRRVRALGFLVKLDTNGSQPERLRRLMAEGLIDMAAMDIKNGPTHYARTVGIPHFDLTPVRESAALLMAGTIPFEFRTTVTDEMHTDADMAEIADWLAGGQDYFLQYYVDSDGVLRPGLHAPSREKMRGFLRILQKKIPKARIRGESI